MRRFDWRKTCPTPSTLYESCSSGTEANITSPRCLPFANSVPRSFGKLPQSHRHSSNVTTLSNFSVVWQLAVSELGGE